MTADRQPLIFTDARGRACVRYWRGAYVGTYTALSVEDAEAFAADLVRQDDDRRFSLLKFQARTGRS